MFEPGHLHLEHDPVQPEDIAYRLDITYAPQASEQGPGMHFQVAGTIGGASVNEGFDLPSDLAFNFASGIEHVARQHGLPTTQVIPLHLHPQYDAMFKDIQQALGRHSGDPVAAEHLGRS